MIVYGDNEESKNVIKRVFGVVTEDCSLCKCLRSVKGIEQ